MPIPGPRTSGAYPGLTSPWPALGSSRPGRRPCPGHAGKLASRATGIRPDSPTPVPAGLAGRPAEGHVSWQSGTLQGRKIADRDPPGRTRPHERRRAAPCMPRPGQAAPAPATAARSPARRPDADVGLRRRADLEMRDLVICSPPTAAASGQDRRRRVRHPALAGLADPLPLPRARRQGPGPPDGPPAILSPARLRQARRQAGQGLTHAEIGRKLGMSRSRITEMIKQHGVMLIPGTLSGDADDTGADPAARDGGGSRTRTAAGTTGGEANRTPAAATAPEPLRPARGAF